MVCSRRGPAAGEVAHLAAVCDRIRGEFPNLELCLSIGLLEREPAEQLKSAGAGWINHNLNMSRRFDPKICSTQSWDDGVRTIENVRAAGLGTLRGRNYRDG